MASTPRVADGAAACLDTPSQVRTHDEPHISSAWCVRAQAAPRSCVPVNKIDTTAPAPQQAVSAVVRAELRSLLHEVLGNSLQQLLERQLELHQQLSKVIDRSESRVSVSRPVGRLSHHHDHHDEERTCHCGTALGADEKFCSKCGRKWRENAKRLCSACGAELRHDSDYCKSCGEKWIHGGGESINLALIRDKKIGFSDQKKERTAGLVVKAGVEDKLACENSLTRIVTSSAFEVFFAIVVVAHAAWTGFYTEQRVSYAVENIGSGSGSDPFAEFARVMETSFLMIYIVEILLRLCVFGPKVYLRGKTWAWAWFDLVLVLFGFFDVLTNDGSFNIAWLRVLRIFKQVVKSLRVFRVVNISFLTTLRLIVCSIMSAMPALVWSIAALVMLMYMFAIVFVEGVAAFLQEPAAASMDDRTREALLLNFGSLDAAMLSEFKAVTGGNPWSGYLDSMELAGKFYYHVWLIYIALLVVAVLRMLTGIFVQAANVAKEKDQANQLIHHVEELFLEVDVDGSGAITAEEFEKCLKSKKATHLLRQIGISQSDAVRLFEQYDQSGDGELDIKEFVDGCTRFSSWAKHIDMAWVTMRIQEMISDNDSFMAYVEQCFDAQFHFPDLRPEPEDLSNRIKSDRMTPIVGPIDTHATTK